MFSGITPCQRLLKQCNVRILFGKLLSKRFPAARVEARRAFSDLLNTVRTVALLQQYQKEAQNGVIDADATDYAIALEIMGPLLMRLRGDLDAATMRLLEIIREKAKPEVEIFTRTNAAVWAATKDSDAGPRLRTLRSVVTDLHIVFARKGRRVQIQFIRSLNHLYWIEMILSAGIRSSLAVFTRASHSRRG